MDPIADEEKKEVRNVPSFISSEILAMEVGADGDVFEDDGLAADQGYDSSSEDEDIVRGAFTYLHPKADSVTVGINSTRIFLLNKAKEEIKCTLSKARNLLSLDTTHIPSSISSVMNIFLVAPFLMKMRDAINRAFATSSTADQQLSLSDIQLCICMLLAMHVYRCSPESFFSVFGGAAYKLKGNETLWKRFMKGLSFMSNGATIEHWNESQNYDQVITKAANDLWPNCVKIFFQKDVTIISADDDQLQLRSVLNAVAGVTRKHNPCKRYGPQNDVFASFGTGGIICSHVISSGQSEAISFEHCIVNLGQAVSISHALQQLYNNMIFLDRGYSGYVNTSLTAKIGLRHLGGIKKNMSAFAEIEHHRAKLKQRVVPSNGFASSYFAKSEVEGKKVISTCFRNGNGKLVHMQANEVDVAAFAYEYEHARADCVVDGADNEDVERKNSRQENDDEFTLLFNAFERNVTLLTEKQGTADWHLLRMFGISGTTAFKLLKLVKSLLHDDEQLAVLDSLSVSRVEEKEVRPRKILTVSSLNAMKVKDLKVCV